MNNAAGQDATPSGDGAVKQTEARARKTFSLLERHVQSRVADGLFELVPLLVTIGAVAFLVSYADGLIRPIIRLLGLPTIDITIGNFGVTLGFDFWGVGAIILAALFYLVGLLISFSAGRMVMNGFSGILARTPVVKVVFGVMRQAMASVSNTKTSFSRVVFVEWPREGMMALGFVTGRIYSAEKQTGMVSVYIPTIPNPTSGNMAFVFEDDVIETNLNPDDAMRLVFSGGIVLPDTVNLARIPSDFEERRITDVVGTFTTMSVPETGDDWEIPAVSQQTKVKS